MDPPTSIQSLAPALLMGKQAVLILRPSAGPVGAGLSRDIFARPSPFLWCRSRNAWRRRKGLGTLRRISAWPWEITALRANNPCRVLPHYLDG